MDLLEAYSSEEEDKIEKDQKRCRRGCVEVVSISDLPADTFERGVPHVRGNWAGHIFAPLTGEWAQQTIESVERFRSALELAGWSGTVVTQTGLHISFSRPFFLQLASIESFQRDLKEALNHERALTLQIDKEMILSNDEGTRSFFGWQLNGSQALTQLLRHIDAIMIKYSQSPYYDPPIFHISLASVQGKIAAKVLDHLPNLEDDDDDFESLVYLQHLKCTFGTTKRFDIVLRT